MSVIKPTTNTGLIIDDFIQAATQHLSTISGMIMTVSLYPPLSTPGPGVVNWVGYMVDTVTPEIPTIDTTKIEPTQEQINKSDTATDQSANINQSTNFAFSDTPVYEDVAIIPIIEPESPQYTSGESVAYNVKPITNESVVSNADINVPSALITAMKKYGICHVKIV